MTFTNRCAARSGIWTYLNRGAMELCLREALHKDGMVVESVQVLQAEEEEGKGWGHRRFKARLEFQPSGIVLGKFLALCCDLDPTNRGHGHRSGWRARYQITPGGHLQIFDFADLGPEQTSATCHWLGKRSEVRKCADTSQAALKPVDWRWLNPSWRRSISRVSSMSMILGVDICRT